ncbi:MAG: hypothetical protein GY846_12800 [Deltaproteobacteria bacterium]|nr:hypothetical protein [Deltaproteobacteria bacterium]
MKCPKCNYTSFDFNRVCPKCGNDTTEEQARMNLSPNKPNPPFFLASLMGVEDSVNLEIPADGVHIPSSRAAAEEMDAQELLIALDDLQPDDTQPDSPEPLDLSTDEIVFDTDDSKEDRLTPFDAAEDEILFDLEPASGENEIESIGIDPLDKKGFSDFDASDEKQAIVGTVEFPEETADIIDETDLFLADEPGSPEAPTEETGPAAISDTLEAPDSQELFLSLDDLPGEEPKPDPSVSTRIEEDDIAFEPEDALNQGEQPALKDTPQALFLEETEDKIDETDLFLADEPTESVPALDEKTSAGTQNKSEEPDSQELFLSLDDLPGEGPKPDPSVSTRIEENDIAFGLEEVLNQEETPDEKGFWDSDEIKKQEAAYGLEETRTKTTDASPKKATDENKNVNLFSDLDIEPLDLELSLEDIDKKP